MSESRRLISAHPTQPGPTVSVLVPVTDDHYPLHRLYEEYAESLEAEGVDFEFVFVFGGPSPDGVIGLQRLQAEGEPIRLLFSAHESPEAALPHVVASDTTAPIIMTLPSYPRVDPASITEILTPLERGVDLVSGARINASDPLVNRVQRAGFHFLLRNMVGGRLTDVACGVRAMRREVLEELDLYGDSFRFVPVLARRDGFQVEEVWVEPHKEDRKTRVYAPGIYLRRLIDLVGLMFLIRFTYRPLRFFGLVGSGLFGSGAVILTVLLLQRLGGRGIADRPLLLLGVLLVVVGLQSLSLGLIGEIVVHHNVSNRPLYRMLPSESTVGPPVDEVEGPIPRRDARPE